MFVKRVPCDLCKQQQKYSIAWRREKPSTNKAEQKMKILKQIPLLVLINAKEKLTCEKISANKVVDVCVDVCKFLYHPLYKVLLAMYK